MRRARIEPDFDQIVDLVVVVRVMLRPKEPRLRALGEPGVGALPFVGVGYPCVHRLVEQDFVAVLSDENRQGHAPGALAGQHPIGLVHDHALDPVLAGRRRPAGALDRLDRKDAKALAARRVGERPVHRQKPLRRVAEDHRRLRPPAMRVLMLEPAARNERAGLGQRVDDGLVGVAGLSLVGDDALALEARRFFSEGAVLIDRIGNARLDSALLKEPRVGRPELEVLASVARSGVDEARAGVFRHVVAIKQGNDEPVAVRLKRMGADHCGERVAFDLAEKLEPGDLGGVEHALGQRLGKDIGGADLGPVAGGRVRHPVAPIWNAAGKGDRAVARNRPGRRGPDENRGVVGFDREGGEDRVADMILVFDLGLGQRGLFHDAPHHRLRAAIEEAIGDEFEDLAGDLRFGGIAHGRIGMVPVADDAEPLELLPLHGKPVLGIGAAFPPEGDDRLRIREVGLRLAFGSVEFLLDLPFDREPVTVPAGNVVGFPPRHLVRAHDDVFQRLVERGADMDVAVGVRRPVVEHEFRTALAA